MLQPAPALAQAQSRQPTTTPELLRLLGIQHASVQHHLGVLAQWLARNTASAELQLSLRANGYGRLLPPPTHPMRPWLPVAKGISMAPPKAS
jgi:hypothetical protein